MKLTSAPCGCTLRFDSDGLIRLQQCNLHAEAAATLTMLKRCLWAFKEEQRKGERGWEMQIADVEKQISKADGRKPESEVA